jgi:hypothetical protein
LSQNDHNEDNLTPYQRWKKNLGEARPWDVIAADSTVPKEVQQERFSICQACPELIKLTHQCKKCGCFMKLKTTLKIAACPIGKWGKHE